MPVPEALTPVLGKTWLARYMEKHPQLFGELTPEDLLKPVKTPSPQRGAFAGPDPEPGSERKAPRKAKARREQQLAPSVKAALLKAASQVTDNGYASESAFQQAVKTALEERGWYVQESLRGSARGGAVFYGKGWPDLQVYKPDGKRLMLYLELKQPGKIPTAAQVACHDRLRAAGFTVLVAYTLQQCLNAADKELKRA